MIDIAKIKALLPHRYPFLLIDRVLECDPGNCATGIKNVTINEHFFQGHFPAEPVMPGVLIVEAMAQLSGILMLADKDESSSSLYFVKIKEATFKAKVVPGDTLHITSTKTRQIGPMCFFQCIAKVGDVEVTSAEIVATLGK